MNIQDLSGFILESCRFSKSSYTFEFCGNLKSEYKTFLVSTSYYFSRKEIDTIDAGENFSLEVWEFLEKTLKSVCIEVDNISTKAVFNFDDGSRFFVWSDEPLEDNLLVVTDPDTGDWIPES